MELLIALVVGIFCGFAWGYLKCDVKWKEKSYSDVGRMRSNALRLKRIFQNSEIETAPKTVNFVSPHYEIIIGIGTDDTASVYISRESLDSLARVYI